MTDTAVTAIGPLRCPCDGRHLDVVVAYTAPPPGEVPYGFSSGGDYHRELLQCGVCGHFVSRHAMNADGLYGGEYVDSTYGADGLRRAFDRIIALEPGRSDNVGRVARVIARDTRPALPRWEAQQSHSERHEVVCERFSLGFG